MKKVLKSVLKFFLALGLFFGLVFYLYFRQVKNSLIAKHSEVSANWRKVYSLSQKRVILVGDLILSDNQTFHENLARAIKANLSNRVNSKGLCSLEFNKLEYDVEKGTSQLLLEKLKPINDSLNLIVGNYNSSALDFNLYYSFPNNITANKLGYKRFTFFDIVYGEKNEDPILKDKEIQEWIKTGKQ